MRSNQAKHKTAPKGSPIFRRAIMVMLTLVLSIACYGVTVFAWFQSEVVNSNNTISSGSYTITVDIKVLNTENPVLGEDGGYTLEAGKGYSVTLTAYGTTRGYCKISAGDTIWNTEVIPGGETFNLTIYPAENANYTFTTVWGAPLNADNQISNGQIGEPPADSQEEPETPVEEENTPPTGDVTTPAVTEPAPTTEAPETESTEGKTTAATEGETTAPAEETTTPPTEVPTTTEAVTETTQPPVQETPAEGEQ